MLRRVSMKLTVGFFAVFGICGAFAQQAPREGGAAGGEARPRATVAPLFFKVDWFRPANQADTKVRYSPVQENIADPNVEIKYYGAARQILYHRRLPGD